MTGSAGDVDVSVVCWVGSDPGDLAELHQAYRAELAQTGRTVEFIYVLDGPRPRAQAAVAAIRDTQFPVTVITMAAGFGEATGLQLGFRRSRGKFVLTIPDRFQSDPAVVRDILGRLDEGEEVVIACRDRRGDAWRNRFQFAVFHALARRVSGRAFQDLTSGVRGLRREVAERLDLYGDLHRFIPILAARRGFRVTEIPVAQHPEDRVARRVRVGIYARRLLDLLNLFFLTRFTVKPLRFFGLIGLLLSLAGLGISGVLAAMRILDGQPLTNRPLLLLGVLLIVLGVQFVTLGLLGEIILFFSPRRELPEVHELSPPAAYASVSTSGPGQDANDLEHQREVP